MGRKTPVVRLNPIQMEFIALLWEGLPVKEIAHRLGKSYKQATDMRKRIGDKLGAHTQWALARYVVEHGLVPLNKVSE